MTRMIVIAGVLIVAIGCNQQSTATMGELNDSATAALFNAGKAPTVAFSVPDMMCPEGCGEKTKEILSEQPGATEVYVDFEGRTATVAIEDGKFDAEQALAALVDHGFDHSTLKDEVAAKPPLGHVFDPEAQTRSELGAEWQAAEPAVQ